MKLWIVKTRSDGWLVRLKRPNRITVDYNGLGYDEMLGCVARIALTDASRLDGTAIGMVDGEWDLEITEVEYRGRAFTIERDGKFIDHLTFDEMLGFVAVYCWTEGDRQLFHGLISYEDWSRRFRRKPFVPAGLLPAA